MIKSDIEQVRVQTQEYYGTRANGLRACNQHNLWKGGFFMLQKKKNIKLGVFVLVILVIVGVTGYGQEPNLYTWMTRNGYYGTEVPLQTFSPGVYRVTVLARYSGHQNSLGFYYTFRSQNPTSFCALRELAHSLAPVRTTRDFVATHEFGLYMNSIADFPHSLGGLFFTEDRLNFDGRQHAKVIQVGFNQWIIGWEDYLDFDYNDLIILLQRL